jgi:cell division transport system permease protein
MKYVGATNSFIRWPFLVEGIIIGIIAAVLTLLIVGVLYDVVIQNIETSLILQQMQITLLKFTDLAKPISIVYIALGVGVGIIGSSMSMKKYLEV